MRGKTAVISSGGLHMSRTAAAGRPSTARAASAASSLKAIVPAASKCLSPRKTGSPVSAAALTRVVASSTVLTYSSRMRSAPASARTAAWSRNSPARSSDDTPMLPGTGLPVGGAMLPAT